MFTSGSEVKERLRKLVALKLRRNGDRASIWMGGDLFSAKIVPFSAKLDLSSAKYALLRYFLTKNISRGDISLMTTLNQALNEFFDCLKVRRRIDRRSVTDLILTMRLQNFIACSSQMDG